jgi:uncharacterized protein (TIGR02246 family)
MFKNSVLIIIFVVAAASQTFPQKSDEAVFKSLIKQMTDAQSAYDAAALDRIFSSDYIEISPAGEFDPREKVLGFYKPELKPDAGKTSVAVEATDYSIRNYEKTAIVVTRLNFLITSDGKQAAPRSMRATVVFRKENGSWKIASTQYTGIRPAPTAAKPSEE